MRRTQFLRAISDGIAETDAVAFHDKWIQSALTKIMNDVGDLPGKVAAVPTPGPASKSPEGQSAVSDEIGPGDDFHKRWMHRVHQKVIRTVDPVLLEDVSEMKDQEVPFLIRPATESLNKKVEMTGSRASNMPAALHMWHRGKKHAVQATWHIGGRGTIGMKKGFWGERRVTHTHMVYKKLPTAKAPWKLPMAYRTVPIPSMHLGGLGFNPLLSSCPVNLRLLLINDDTPAKKAEDAAAAAESQQGASSA
eukprot:TRINITY_DN47536_c0_g1_i1.p1 TRINITY_DN47536_c0_g1~~TRINITY_DN47536_c0_g1_i1.p1  ORF type:complete len:292 (+),score=92.46 TRINITY_DN47536_c0_g1_i1:127-876(+)